MDTKDVANDLQVAFRYFNGIDMHEIWIFDAMTFIPLMAIPMVVAYANRFRRPDLLYYAIKKKGRNLSPGLYSAVRQALQTPGDSTFDDDVYVNPFDPEESDPPSDDSVCDSFDDESEPAVYFLADQNDNIQDRTPRIIPTSHSTTPATDLISLISGLTQTLTALQQQSLTGEDSAAVIQALQPLNTTLNNMSTVNETESDRPYVKRNQRDLISA
jgi:hypothetical protein